MLCLIIKYPFSITSRISKFYRDPKSKSLLKPIKYYPKQHPKNISSSDTSIIKNNDRPTTNLTPYREVPISLYLSKENTVFSQPKNPKILHVGIFGSTNVGKSSLFNRILGENISAISRKSNTTHEKITGIYTNVEKNTQLCLYDTPGINIKYRKTKTLVNKAWEIMNEINYALFVIDASKKRVDEQTKEMLQKISNFKRKFKNINEINDQEDMSKIQEISSPDESDILSKALIVNKIDLCTNKRDLKWYLNELEDLGNFDKTIYVSCETGFGLEQLKNFLEEESLPGKWLYSPEINTNLSDIDKIEEILKGLIFERFHRELPFIIGYEIKEFVILSNGKAHLTFQLIVETIVQMKMLVGYHARNIKFLKEKMRVELIKLFKKDFIINFMIIKKKDRPLEEYTDITSKDYGLEKIKIDLERLKKEKNQQDLTKFSKELNI